PEFAVTAIKAQLLAVDVVHAIEDVVIVVLDGKRSVIVVDVIGSVARTVRFPESRHVRSGDGIQHGRRNGISCKGLTSDGSAVSGSDRAPGIVDGAETAESVQRLGKIALTFQIGGESVEKVIGVGLFPLLIREEVEQFVFENRIAEGASPDV